MFIKIRDISFMVMVSGCFTPRLYLTPGSVHRPIFSFINRSVGFEVPYRRFNFSASSAASISALAVLAALAQFPFSPNGSKDPWTAGYRQCHFPFPAPSLTLFSYVFRNRRGFLQLLPGILHPFHQLIPLRLFFSFFIIFILIYTLIYNTRLPTFA
jgi:hypothetical protein